MCLQYFTNIRNACKVLSEDKLDNLYCNTEGKNKFMKNEKEDDSHWGQRIAISSLK